MPLAICQKEGCRATFFYKGRRPCLFCPACREENERASKARWRKRATHGRRSEMHGLVQMPYKDVARIMGVSESTVRQWELSALEKIRTSPQLREAWDSLKEGGFRILDTPLADPGERLLQYQLQVLELWRVRGLAAAAGNEEDAQWCAEQIVAVQQKIEQIL